MKAKFKAFFDSPATWATIGAFAGSALGSVKAQAIVAGIGSLVMAIL